MDYKLEKAIFNVTNSACEISYTESLFLQINLMVLDLSNLFWRFIPSVDSCKNEKKPKPQYFSIFKIAIFLSNGTF